MSAAIGLVIEAVALSAPPGQVSVIMAGLVITENGRVITRLMARDHGPGHDLGTLRGGCTACVRP
jgi:hypothetical protein